MNIFKMDKKTLNQSSLDKSSLAIPICIGMLGWDMTTIGDNSIKRSYGGSALHYVVASAIIGIKLKLISYISLSEWGGLINGLASQGIDISEIIDFPEIIEFHIFYDSKLNFRVDKFWEKIPKNEPDILGILDKRIQEGQLVHVCPTTPEQDIRSIYTLKNKKAKISMQLHVFNLLKNVHLYRDSLGLADYLFMNEEEAKILSGERDIDLAIEVLRKSFQATFYITSSLKSLAVTREGIFRCPSLNASVLDPTGAGDAFAGGCTAGRILTGRHDIGLRMGTLCAVSKLANYSSSSLLSLLNIRDQVDLPMT